MTKRARSRSTKAGHVQVFVIFDVDHDEDLYELICAHSHIAGCGFDVVGGSERSVDTEAGRERARLRMAAADQVIIICGEHADSSPRVHSELLIARGEERPYFLLWGRRGIMCTKPMGAKTTEGMYSWTRQFVHDQLAINLRQAGTETTAKSLRNPPRNVQETAPPAIGAH